MQTIITKDASIKLVRDFVANHPEILPLYYRKVEEGKAQEVLYSALLCAIEDLDNQGLFTPLYRELSRELDILWRDWTFRVSFRHGEVSSRKKKLAAIGSRLIALSLGERRHLQTV